jgi:hypothetical protein
VVPPWSRLRRRNKFTEAIESLERARGLSADNLGIDGWLNWAGDRPRTACGS